MIRHLHSEMWAFDAEWVPDTELGRKLFGLGSELTDREVMAVMWEQAGATPERPRPFLKLIQSRVVSIAAIVRRERSSEAEANLEVVSLPRLQQGENDPDLLAEREILARFLGQVGKRRPQLVGFNSRRADLRIFIQRAVRWGLAMPELCERPLRRDIGPDYLGRWENDFHIDIQEALTGGTGGALSLNELALACGLPGKILGTGDDVAEWWLAGQVGKIVAYNELDAVTTYLVALRCALFGGAFTEEQYHQEVSLVEQLLAKGGADRPLFTTYLQAWREQPTVLP